MEAKRSAYAIFSVDPGGTTGVCEAVVDIDQPTVAAAIRRAWRKGLLRTYEIKGEYANQAWALARESTDFWFRQHVELSRVRAGNIRYVTELFTARSLAAEMISVQVNSGAYTLLQGAFGIDVEKEDMPASWVALSTFYSEQSASEAKGFCSDDMLKNWGLWKKRSTHERDAIRHLARRIDRLMNDKG